MFHNSERLLLLSSLKNCAWNVLKQPLFNDIDGTSVFPFNNGLELKKRNMFSDILGSDINHLNRLFQKTFKLGHYGKL